MPFKIFFYRGLKRFFFTKEKVMTRLKCNMNKNWLPLKAVLSLLFIFGSVQDASALLDHDKGRGMLRLSESDHQQIEKKCSKIAQVKPNKLGAERIQSHLKSNGQNPIEITIAKTTEEEITLHHGHIGALPEPILGTPLPSAVNNSQRVAFPPIGDQGSLGSCVGWASTYYQASHELALLNGYNNKANSDHILSPKWTYNLLNGGENNGLVITDAYDLLAQSGAPSIVNFPYDQNYLAWDLDPNDWVHAISNRLTPPQLVSGIGGTSQDLTRIKQLLNNGHILTIGTFIDSWVFTKIKQDPANPNSPYVGQWAVSWMNGENGGHCITIVGYDDNLWIDINEDGEEHPNERGAFLLANSWGTGWANNGFIWVSYDAFLSASAIHNGPNTNRVPLAAAMNNYAVSVLPKATNYAPKLIAKFELKQDQRNQIAVEGGVSSPNVSKPAKLFKSDALANSGGSFEFDGTTSDLPEAATFTLDFTDLIDPSKATQRYFLNLNSSTDHPIQLNSFCLLDLTHGRQIDYAKTLPYTLNSAQESLYIDYDYANNSPPPDSIPPAVLITAPVDNAVVKGSVEVAVNATDNVAISRVEFYVDSVLQFIEAAAPYSHTLDTKSLTNGIHTLTAITYDTSHNKASKSIVIQVQNPVPHAVNVGGGMINFGGLVWQADRNVIGSASLFSLAIANVNPIYSTQRYGNFSYVYDVDNGDYLVTLQFAELCHRSAGKRVFNVSINGSLAVKQLDVFKVAGYATPYDVTFPVTVTNKRIRMDFYPVVDQAIVNGIQFVKQ